MIKENPVTNRQHILDEVIHGLSKENKELSSKLFYDEKGSKLFDQICELDEYYPTRTETKILKNNLNEILDYFEKDTLFIELGSGSSTKTRILLDALNDLTAYIPVDISEDFLYKTSDQLNVIYPSLNIIPVCADYTKSFEIPSIGNSFNKKIVFYPGSTIGNFKPAQAKKFLHLIAEICENGGGLLIGVDLKKEKRILEAAYNDSSGITAAFNLNMLHRLNNELNADFDIRKFRHKAFYNEDKGRIEMHLVSTAKQVVSIGNTSFFFQKNESIHTENSYKYSLDEFKELASDYFEVRNIWTDDRQLFSVQYLQVKTG
jgi:dimethylhistidine N-methyltransferase